MRSESKKWSRVGFILFGDTPASELASNVSNAIPSYGNGLIISIMYKIII